MEITKKIVIVILGLFFFNSCTQEEYRNVKDYLYEDNKGILYVKVKNFPLLHPSKDLSKIRDSIFISEVFDVSTQTSKSLTTVIDRNTFKKVDNTGNYFSDKNYVFVYMSQPKPNQFYFIKNNNYLTVDNFVYYKGIKLADIDINKASLFYILNSDRTNENEFYTDGKFLYLEDVLLEPEYLDINEKIKDSLKSVFLRQENNNRKNSRMYDLYHLKRKCNDFINYYF